jgi:MarR family transcriptional regulator, organic hydroperoxide resistance regulator
MVVPRTPHALTNLGSVLGFMRLIWAVDHGIQRTSKRMAAVLGLTGPQRLVLRILGRNEGITPGALALILHLHPSTLTGILRRLEERGVIRREPDIRDSRRSLLFLTPEGRKLDVSVKSTIEDAVRRALARSSPERIEEASELLAAVARSLSRMAANEEPAIPGSRVGERRSSPRASGPRRWKRTR